MLIAADRSVLLVVDVQTKLMPVMPEAEALTANIVWLVRVAQRLGVPVAALEQNPGGLGPLVPNVRQLLDAAAIASKMNFSAVAAECLAALPGSDRPQVVIAGIEAHVCLMQTALELIEEGRYVYVVADCVASRHPHDRDAALARMRDEGARVVTREMVAFEWLEMAGTALFRDVHREFLR